MSLSGVLTNRDDPPVERAPLWAVIVALVLSLAGWGVSLYLTLEHFSGAPLACPDTGIINCTKVTTSGESYFLHIPVALLGLIFYTVIVAINTPWAWRAADRRIHLARLVLISGGMAFAIWLVAAEALIIKNICLYCTSVHVITLFLFILTMATVPRMLGWLGRAEWYDDDDDQDYGDFDDFDGEADALEDGDDGAGEPVGVDGDHGDR
jgi:uncharacterized membrane protein